MTVTFKSCAASLLMLLMLFLLSVLSGTAFAANKDDAPVLGPFGLLR